MNDKRCSQCKNFYPSDFYHKNRSKKDGLQDICKSCSSLNCKAYRETHSEKIRNQIDQWRLKNKDLFDRQVKRSHLKRKFNLSLEQAEEIYSRGCEICGAKEGRLCIDHCHDTSIVRGCLCSACNVALGHYEKNILPKLNIVNKYLKRGR